MRITLIGPFPPFRGGISDFNYSLFKELSKSHELQIINFSTLYPKLLFPGKSQFKTATGHLINSDRILSSINPLTWRKSAHKIIDFQPEIVIIHYWLPFFAPTFSTVIGVLKKRLNVKVIAICHNIIPHENHNIYQLFTKKLLTKIDRFLVMSDSVKSVLLKFIPSAKYKVSPHPIYNIFGDIIDKDKARLNLGIKAKKVILFFGMIREYKGLDILLNGIPKIKQKLNDFIVIVAGESYENTNKYYSIIEKLKIQDNVDLRLKFIDDSEVSQYFSAADIVALPYRSATQSGITQIAYNFDRPVIISDVGGLAEIALDGKTGYVVPPQPDEFAKAIIRFFQTNKFHEFSQNVKIHKKLYTWKNFEDNLMELSHE